MLLAPGIPGPELLTAAALACATAVLGAALWCRSRAGRARDAERALRHALDVARSAVAIAPDTLLPTRICEHAATLLGCRLVEIRVRPAADRPLQPLGSCVRGGVPAPGASLQLQEQAMLRGRLKGERSFALALRDRSGQPCGVLACEHDQPLRVTLEQERVLESLVQRAELAVTAVPVAEPDQEAAVGGATRCEVRSLTRAAEAAADAIFLTDQHGVIKWVNPAFEAITGWKRELALGRKANLLKSGAHDLDYYKHLWGEITAGRTWSGRVVNRRHDGGIYHAAQTIAPLSEADGTVCGFVAVQRDVSHEVEREMQLVHLQQELGQSARQLEDRNRNLEILRKAAAEASAVKSRFLARTSHEMRTPLHGIMGFVDILLEGEQDAQRRGHLLEARVSGRQLLAMVEDFLDVSQIEESERQPLENSEFELEPLLEGLLALYEQRARDKGLTLRHVLRPQPAPRLRGDPTRLRRVLKYALERQIKDTSEGVVEFEIDVRPVNADRADLSIRVVAAAPADDQAVEVTLARRLVTSLGGKLDLDAVPGRGSMCRVWLPLALVEPEGKTARLGALPAAHLEPASAGRVLLVDDNPVNQRVAHLVLSRAHFEVHLADDGRQATERAAAVPYDLILMDCQMPVMDGFAATRAIRAQERPGHRVPIVAMTARALDGERQRCLDVGMDDFLAKPVQPEELRRLAARYIRGSQATPAGGPQSTIQGDDASPAGELPGVVERLQELGMLAEPSLAIESLELFLTDVDMVLEELHRAVQQKDHVATGGLAHRLKGAAANLGATRLAEIARAIEDAGDRREPVTLGELAAEVARVRGSVLRLVASLKAAGPSPVASPGVG